MRASLSFFMLVKELPTEMSAPSTTVADTPKLDFARFGIPIGRRGPPPIETSAHPSCDGAHSASPCFGYLLVRLHLRLWQRRPLNPNTSYPRCREPLGASPRHLWGRCVDRDVGASLLFVLCGLSDNCLQYLCDEKASLVQREVAFSQENDGGIVKR